MEINENKGDQAAKKGRHFTLKQARNYFLGSLALIGGGIFLFLRAPGELKHSFIAYDFGGLPKEVVTIHDPFGWVYYIFGAIFAVTGLIGFLASSSELVYHLVRFLRTKRPGGGL